jgi:SpoVK/Ycf46/Vps4 family AAA+-type ATPase
MTEEKALSPWIKELKLQRLTMFGPLLLVETDDERRYRALLQQRPEFVKRNEEWFTLENWKGFRKVIVNEKDKKIDYEVIKDAKDMGGDISALLKEVSEKMLETPSVLVIKNILKTNDFINNVLYSWATDMEIMYQGSSVVMFLEDRNILPQSIWSRTKVVTPPKSTEDERQEDLKSAIDNGAIEVDKKIMPSAVRLLAGLNLDQIDALITEMSIRNRGKTDIDLLARLKTAIIAQDPVIDIINPPKFGFEGVGGYKELKNRIYNDIILPIKYPEYAKEYSIGKPRGLLLYGPPGTGKTLLAKALQKELNMTMITMQPDKIYSKWVGESEKAFRRVFKYLDAMSPCLFFVDEIDRYGKRNTSGGSGDDSGGAQVNRQIFSMLLEKLGDEDREWFFVANTNLVETIDPAMRRTGRIDSVVPVPFPDEAARVEILKIHSTMKRKLKLADDIDWKELASKTEYWSGSDLETLVVRTSTMKMEDAVSKGVKGKIGQDDFIKALDTFNIDIRGNKKQQEETERQALKFTNDERLRKIFKEGVAGDSYESRVKSLKKEAWKDIVPPQSEKTE